MPGRIYEKIGQELRLLKQELKASSGMYTAACSKARGARIIVYHGVCKDHPTRFNTLFISEKTFRKHLELYRKYFHIISLQDYYDNNFSGDRFNVCLTFDDGFANNHTYVLPLLEEYAIPAAFFVTAIRDAGYDILWNDFLTLASVTGPDPFVFENDRFHKKKGRYYVSVRSGKTLAAILQQSGFGVKQKLMQALQPYASFRNTDIPDAYWLQMTTEQVREAAASPLITIGSHGYYHNDLSQLPERELIDELQSSRTFLEQVTGKPVTAIAFPYGHYSPAVVEGSIQAGYRQLLATEFRSPGDAGNMLLKERMGVNPFISAKNQLYAIVKGNYAY